MAAIPYTFTERNTQQTTTSTTYQEVTSIAQASGLFTAGKRYLIVVTAQTGADASGKRHNIHVIHGSTEFEGSLQHMIHRDGSEKQPYAFSTVWTAVASEGVSVQFRVDPSGAAATVSVDYVSLLTIQLTDSLTENTDFFFNERTADDTLTAALITGGSITFTPSTASQDWLILTNAQYDPGGVGTPIRSRMNKDTATTVLPQALFTPINDSGINVLSTARVFNLPASSTTILEESSNATPVGIRQYSNIIALNLDKFAAHASAYTDGDLTYTATAIASPDELQTTSLTPTVTGDVWIVGYFGFNKAVSTYTNQFRVQVDGADQPSGQTTAAYVFGASNSATDELPVVLSTLTSLSNASHTIDLDGAVSNTTSSPSAQQRTIMAVTMELASSYTLWAQSLL